MRREKENQRTTASTTVRHALLELIARLPTFSVVRTAEGGSVQRPSVNKSVNASSILRGAAGKLLETIDDIVLDQIAVFMVRDDI